jgi:NDP-sugar pyrophosphorylase family protein
LLFFSLQACNNDNDNAGAEKDPSVMHPPSEAIPDSTKLVNDSVIQPDVIPGNGSQVVKSDSIQKNKNK